MHGYWLGNDGVAFWGINMFRNGSFCKPISQKLHDAPLCTRKLWAWKLFVEPTLVVSTASAA
jgi:hypothetical protein